LPGGAIKSYIFSPTVIQSVKKASTVIAALFLSFKNPFYSSAF
jgi:hypothetical protein